MGDDRRFGDCCEPRCCEPRCCDDNDNGSNIWLLILLIIIFCIFCGDNKGGLFGGLF
ncbi:MAG: hypothetical protein ACI4LP_10300 [Anaerovoracaceae bacterium]